MTFISRSTGSLPTVRVYADSEMIMPTFTGGDGYQLARLGPVPVIVQDASEHAAARVHADLVRWYDQASVR